MLKMSWSRLVPSIVAPALAVSSAFAADAFTGPSSSQAPYVLPTRPAGVTESLLTVGDSVNFKADGVTPYRMVGIPDGLGAFDNGDGTFTVLMNHEISSGGVARDHGLAGAFVSRWVIDKETHAVLHGEDLMKAAYSWDVATAAYQPLSTPLSRLCSADLPALSAFYNSQSGLGYLGRIFMDGEESGTNGRAFAHFMDGNSYEIPRLGKFSWENSVANPNTGDATVVIGLDDSVGGQVYVYAGSKSSSSDRVIAAGLGNGTLSGIKVQGLGLETDATVVAPGTPFTIESLGDVSAKSGSQIDLESKALGITGFNRPEDGSWNPSNPNDFYFVTTASFAGRSRLWRLRFVDAANPSLGGTIDMLLDGTTGPKMMDNITVSKRGSVYIQEDVGNNAHIGKIWRYSIATGKLEIVAQHDPARFLPGGPGFLTIDEESSGIIPLDDILGESWYLFDVQAHYNAGDAELVEGGQLLLMHFPPGQEK
jgi:Bacterial protein of unknown function (DUF839)